MRNPIDEYGYDEYNPIYDDISGTVDNTPPEIPTGDRTNPPPSTTNPDDPTVDPFPRSGETPPERGDGGPIYSPEPPPEGGPAPEPTPPPGPDDNGPAGGSDGGSSTGSTTDNGGSVPPDVTRRDIVGGATLTRSMRGQAQGRIGGGFRIPGHVANTQHSLINTLMEILQRRGQ